MTDTLTMMHRLMPSAALLGICGIIGLVLHYRFGSDFAAVVSVLVGILLSGMVYHPPGDGSWCVDIMEHERGWGDFRLSTFTYEGADAEVQAIAHAARFNAAHQNDPDELRRWAVVCRRG